LAIVEGAADILDLIEIYADEKGMPEKVYLVGASAGGLITVLLAEQMPSSVDGAVAACGPIGDFRRQLDYFGNARVLFEVFWPGLFPGKPFDPHPDVVGSWPEYFDDVVWPTISAEKDRLNEWFRVAELAVDAAATPASFETTARDVLSYTTLNSRDAEDTLGGFPFDNATTFYDNTRFPLLVNARVPRFVADAAALEEIEAHYQTSGNVDAPVVTLHTKLDQQVPYFHEPLYIKKTIAGDHFLTDHFHVPIARYGHCNFTAGEGLFAFALMLLYAGDLSEIQGVGELLSEAQLADFERLAIEHGLPYRIGGEPGVIRD
jgi:pimeloyl-ACP methyl ester carboxylesterase